MSETTIQRTFRVLFKDITSADLRRRRLIGIIQGVVTSMGSRVLGMAITLVSVPLTIGYLGTERYGAWLAVGSVLAWMQITDFGLGNGLTNAITTAAGEDRPDRVRMHVSNGVVVFSAFAAVIGLAAAVAWPFIDWGALVGAKTPGVGAELGAAAAIALATFLIGFPLSVAGKLYMALQEARIGNYWGMAGKVAGLLALLAVTQTNGGLVRLVLAISGVPTLVGLANAIWMFGWRRPHLAPRLRYVDFAEMRTLGGVAGQFFLIQILALVTFETDNVVIGHFLGADRVPEYSLTYGLFNYTSLPQSLLFSYLWAAYTEAMARKDIAWVRRTYRLNLMVGMGFTAVAVAGLVIVAQPFINWWTNGSVSPSMSLVGWMAAWAMINAYTNPMACLLASASHLRAQIAYSAVEAAVNIPLSIYLVHIWGPAGVIAGTVIAYALFICVPILIDVERLLGKLERAT